MTQSLQLIVEYPGDGLNQRKESSSNQYQSTPDSSAETRTRTVRYRIVQVNSDQSNNNSTTTAAIQAYQSQSVMNWAAFGRFIFVHLLVGWIVYISSTYSLTDRPHAGFIFASALALYLSARLLLSTSTTPPIYEESILLIPGLGLQLESAWFASLDKATQPHPQPIRRHVREFIEIERVKEILINEGIQQGQVRYYLLILLHLQSTHPTISSYSAGRHSPSRLPPATEQIVLPFQQLQPRFPLLLDLYRGLTPYLSVNITDSIKDTRVPKNQL